MIHHLKKALRVGLIVLVPIGILPACTSITVQPMNLTPRPQHICIERNRDVIVRDFVQVVQEGIARHNMTSEVYSGRLPDRCDLKLNYTALRSWDFGPYLSVAELVLTKNGEEVGRADYHLVAKGGLSLFKWQGTKTKMDPVIDQLFSSE